MRYRSANPIWRDWYPQAITLTLTTALVLFFTQYLSVFEDVASVHHGGFAREFREVVDLAVDPRHQPHPRRADAVRVVALARTVLVIHAAVHRRRPAHQRPRRIPRDRTGHRVRRRRARRRRRRSARRQAIRHRGRRLARVVERLFRYCRRELRRRVVTRTLGRRDRARHRVIARCWPDSPVRPSTAHIA